MNPPVGCAQYRFPIMAVTLEISPENEAALKAQAQVLGLTLEQWLINVAEQLLPAPQSISHLQSTNPEEWARQFDSWVRSHDPNTPLSPMKLSAATAFIRTVSEPCWWIRMFSRAATPASPLRGGRQCHQATDVTRRNPYIVPRNLVEFWVVATRPASQNGLGMSVAAASGELTRIKRLFEPLPELPTIFPVWQSLVIRHAISGKPAHDARLVAAMQAHGIRSVLTFNRTDFYRFPGIEVFDPFETAPIG